MHLQIVLCLSSGYGTDGCENNILEGKHILNGITITLRGTTCMLYNYASLACAEHCTAFMISKFSAESHACMAWPGLARPPTPPFPTGWAPSAAAQAWRKGVRLSSSLISALPHHRLCHKSFAKKAGQGPLALAANESGDLRCEALQGCRDPFLTSEQTPDRMPDHEVQTPTVNPFRTGKNQKS